MATEPMRFGLKEATINQISSVFSSYPTVDKAIIYGSRSKGNYRNGSDIDLTLIGSALTYDQLNQIETQLDDLLLPYCIDLSLFNQIDNLDLIDHINRVGQVFYLRLPPSANQI